MGDPILLVQHYFFKNFPLPLSKTDLTDKPKNKWGPMDENILFFLLKNVFLSLSNLSQLTIFAALIPETYISWGLVPSICARSVHRPYRV